MRVWGCIAVLLLAAGAASGNDLVDAGEAIGDFLLDTFGDPDGASTDFVMGDEAGAIAISLSEDWKIAWLEIPQIERTDFSASIGATIKVSDTEVAQFQPIAGASVRLTNIKGTQLRLGIRLCSADISERMIDLGPLGRLHYAPVIELRKPL